MAPCLGTKARATFQQPSKQTKHEARTRHLKAALLRGQNAAKGRHREKDLADGSERKAFKKYYWCFVRSTIEKRICEGVVVGRGVSVICHSIIDKIEALKQGEEPYLFTVESAHDTCILCTHAFSTRSLADLVCTPVHYMYPTCTYIELSGSDSAFTAPSDVRPFSHIQHSTCSSTSFNHQTTTQRPVRCCFRSAVTFWRGHYRVHPSFKQGWIVVI